MTCWLGRNDSGNAVTQSPPNHDTVRQVLNSLTASLLCSYTCLLHCSGLRQLYCSAAVHSTQDSSPLQCTYTSSSNVQHNLQASTCHPALSTSYSATTYLTLSQAHTRYHTSTALPTPDCYPCLLHTLTRVMNKRLAKLTVHTLMSTLRTAPQNHAMRH